MIARCVPAGTCSTWPTGVADGTAAPSVAVVDAADVVWVVPLGTPGVAAVVGASHGVQVGDAEDGEAVGAAVAVVGRDGVAGVTTPAGGVGPAVAPPDTVQALQARAAAAPAPSSVAPLGRPAMLTTFPDASAQYSPERALIGGESARPSTGPRRFATPGRP